MLPYPQKLEKLLATVLILLTTATVTGQATDAGQPSGMPLFKHLLPAKAGGIADAAGRGAPKRASAAGGLGAGSVSFLPAVSYASGGLYAESVTITDVNGDGKPDLVVANQCVKTTNEKCGHGLMFGSVSVLLGNGDGTFQPELSYGSGGIHTLSVAVADVNRDGKPDLLVTNRNCLKGCSGGIVSVLLNNGDGTFRPPVIYSSGQRDAWSIAVADVNGDGMPDLVVSDGDESFVSVLLGNGDGTFQPALSYASGEGGTFSVVVADVNGDGTPDVLVTKYSGGNNGNGSVGVLLGNGDGTFQPVVHYDSGGFSPIAPNALAVRDVNGDGKLDLVVANTCSSSTCSGQGVMGVLLGNGDGTFQRVVTYDSGGEAAESVAVADVNDDGKPDMLVANFASGTVGVLLGNGDGTFQPAISDSSSGGLAQSIAVADVNRDGKPDIVVGNTNTVTFQDSVGVLLNNTVFGKSATSTALISSLNPSIYGQSVTWTATVTSSGSITPTGNVRFTWSGHTIGSATLNSSGVATLTRSNLNADTYPLTAVYLGDADNLGSTSAVLNQLVRQTTSAATIGSSPNPSTHGQALTFTAKISSPTVIATGPVTFTAGKTVLGTAQLSGGKANLVISSLPVGSTKVTVTYYGDSNIAKSSASVTQTVH